MMASKSGSMKRHARKTPNDGKVMQLGSMAVASIVLALVHLGSVSLAPGSDLRPIELQPYRIAVVVDGGGHLEEKAVDRWAESVRVGLRAAAGTLWTVEKVAVRSGASGEAIERVSPKADKSFLCRLARDADGRVVVRVHMRDWVVGPGADQTVAVRLTNPAELVDATLRGVAAVFGARGEVDGEAERHTPPGFPKRDS